MAKFTSLKKAIFLLYFSMANNMGYQWRIQDSCGGGVDLQHGHFLVKMYAKTKELGPIGGHAPSTPRLDPPMVMPLFREEGR